MTRFLVGLLFVSLSLPGLARAQQREPQEEKGTYLGVLFGSVRDGQGVVVTHVLPKSPADEAKINREDIVLQYDKTKIKDCEHFARLILADKPDHKVNLLLLRDGKEMNVAVTLTTGPALRIANASKTTADPVPKGTAKPNGPGSVSVTALPLGKNEIKLTIEYYEEGRLATASCSGDPKKIEQEIEKLPTRRIQEIAKTALSRIRDLNLQTTSPAPVDPKN
jgi:hypothetical protein